MTTRSKETAESSARDFSGVLTRYLVSYLENCASPGTLERVFARAGETRPGAAVADASSWSSYAQYRSLLEATGAELDGLTTLSAIGQHVYDVILSPEMAEAMSALGTPGAVYAALPGLSDSIAAVLQMGMEALGPDECRLSLRFRDGYEPFPENCAYQMGLYAIMPRIFGYPDAEVIVESCQCDGAEACRAHVRWDSTESDGARVTRAELQAQWSQARLEELQRTVAELVSGDGLEIVLGRVVAAAARAVPALGYFFDIKASASAERWICTEGVDVADAIRIADGHDGAASSAQVCRVEVASDRAAYGNLIALRSGTAPFEPHERSTLESYAGLAASALDSEGAIVEARRQAASAQALLTLSSSLGELVSTEEMGGRLARAIPSIVNCDRASVWLSEPGGRTGRVSAMVGFDPLAEAELRSLKIPLVLDGPPPTQAWRHDLATGRTALSSALVSAGSVAALSFPITYAEDRYGWMTIDVTHHPERLDDDDDITERLRGLAGQAAIAIRNTRLLEQIRYQALHDHLTGLPNRVLVVDRMEQTLARARREHLDVAVMFIDLDGFKGINDNFGHAVGDQVLKAVAARFAGTLRESDTVARLGGDEFVVLAEGLSLAAGPELVAERLLAVLAEPFPLSDDSEASVSVTASIGIAAGRRETADELLRDADIALYAAKDAGKNRYIVFEAEMQTALRSRHELEMDLQVAIGADQFFLLYQPIFNLTDMSVVGVEALLRWRHPIRGLLQPDEFIPTLEESGLIIPVGRWVLLEACRQAMAWRRDGQPTRMSVNASGRQLDADALLNDVRRALAMSGLPPDDLVIEITETSLMCDTKRAKNQLIALKSLGVGIAIDDFGTGYSSLAYLQQFPVDCLKIDRSFIAGIGQSPEGDALIHTFMQLGKALHLVTLAEGIEETNQLSQLQAEQCDVGQGFLFSRPLPPEEVQRMLAKRAPVAEPATHSRTTAAGAPG
jgi:diguanylate cyclase (GGDEF)-like protein